MTLLKASVNFPIKSSGRRFVEINLVEKPLGRYDIRSNTSSTATYMYKTVSKLSIIVEVLLLTVLN